MTWRARVLGGMIGSLFLRSYERSERIYAAMLSRGFQGNVRTMRAKGLRATDLVVAIGFVIYLLVILTVTTIWMEI